MCDAEALISPSSADKFNLQLTGLIHHLEGAAINHLLSSGATGNRVNKIM